MTSAWVGHFGEVTMVDRGTPARPAKGYVLPPPDIAKQWEEISPGLAEQLYKDALADSKHDRRTDWLQNGLQLTGQIAGVAVVILLVWFGRYCIQHNDAWVAATVLGAPMVALAVVFVLAKKPTGSLASSLRPHWGSGEARQDRPETESN